MDRRRRPKPRRYFARQRLTVILFARSVVIGRGKRRLAKDIGDINAWRFYREALRATIRIIALDPRWSCVVAIDPATAVRQPGVLFSVGPGRGLRRSGQAKGDLGTRMICALNAAPPGPAVLIGSDIQGLTPSIIMRGLIACNASDIVFGPADDGGFWLIGAKKALSLRRFEIVAWSEPSTLKDAESALPTAWRSKHIDRLRDVDDLKDLIETKAPSYRS